MKLSSCVCSEMIIIIIIIIIFIIIMDSDQLKEKVLQFLGRGA